MTEDKKETPDTPVEPRPVDITMRLIDHIVESSQVTAELVAKMTNMHLDVSKLPAVIAKEGSEKCNSCPANNAIVKLILDNSNDATLKPAKTGIISRIILSMMENKYLWMFMGLLVILILVILGFNVPALLHGK